MWNSQLHARNNGKQMFKRYQVEQKTSFNRECCGTIFAE